MKKFFLIAMLAICGTNNVSAQSYFGNPLANYITAKQQATITFRNQSDHTMTIKIMHAFGGLYTTVYLPAHGSKDVYFNQSEFFNMKIKAEHNGCTSYHNGGKFSVTCTEREWTAGEISFALSVYGNGLGPSISKKEYESNN